MSKRKQIEECLDEIERSRGVRILLAVESGSRAWGFASPDSDYDVRFIYVGDVRDYLRVDQRRDVIELPITDDLDVNGWDIVKALMLFRKSNPPLLEWLQSPIVYREQGDFATTLRNLASTRYSQRRLAYHYLSMAKQNFYSSIAGREEVSRKKYLYVLRPLAAIYWLREYRTPPPTSLISTLEGVRFPPEIGRQLDALLAQKRQGFELATGTADPILNDFITAELENVHASLEAMDDPEMDADLLNQLLWAELGLDSV